MKAFKHHLTAEAISILNVNNLLEELERAAKEYGAQLLERCAEKSFSKNITVAGSNEVWEIVKKADILKLKSELEASSEQKYTGRVEVLLDDSSLPDDGETVWFLDEEFEVWHKGEYIKEDQLFYVSPKEQYRAWDVIRWTRKESQTDDTIGLPLTRKKISLDEKPLARKKIQMERNSDFPFGRMDGELEQIEKQKMENRKRKKH